jgi:hypothetical protein
MDKVGWRYYQDFSRTWGDPELSDKSLNHFLLKLQFTDIWQDELVEDYFPMDPQDYHNVLHNILGMECLHYETYLLDYIRDNHMRGKLGMTVGDTYFFSSHGLLAYEKGRSDA